MLVVLAGGGLLIIKNHFLEKNIIVKRYKRGKKNIGEKAQDLLRKKGASIFIIWVLNTFALVVTF
jgi:hypothetical protein